jgi:hypothetical protein
MLKEKACQAKSLHGIDELNAAGARIAKWGLPEPLSRLQKAMEE